MKKQTFIMSAIMLVFVVTMTSMVLAHETSDQAPDTPLGSEQALDNALDNLLDAVDNSNGNAANSLFRNPTCGAHFSSDGIHPVGSP